MAAERKEIARHAPTAAESAAVVGAATLATVFGGQMPPTHAERAPAAVRPSGVPRNRTTA